MFGLFGKKKEKQPPVILDLSVKEKPDGWDELIRLGFGMDDDMSVRLQTEIIISMTGFAVTLEYPEYKTDALRIGGDVQMELVNAAIIHRIDPAMGSADEIMDTLWVRARLVARNNKPLIQAVAARLDHYGFWTGEEIQRIIDDCEKELDR